MSPVPFVAWRSDLDRARRLTANLSEQLSRKDAALVQAQQALAREQAITAELSDAYLRTFNELSDANAKVAAMAARDRQPRPGPLRGPGGRFARRAVNDTGPEKIVTLAEFEAWYNRRTPAGPQTTPPPMTGVPAGGVPSIGPATTAGPVDAHDGDLDMATHEVERYAKCCATAAAVATEVAPHDQGAWIATYYDSLAAQFRRDQPKGVDPYFVIEDFDFTAERAWDEYHAGLDVPDIDDHPDDRA